MSVLVDVEEPIWLSGLGLCCLSLAVLFAAPPFYLLKRLGNPEKGAGFFSTTKVVDKGLYSLVRHPQYLGYVFLVIGFCCLDPHLLSMVFAVSAVVSFYLQACAEERYCSVHLGSEYDDYAKRVPRFNFVRGVLKIFCRRFK